MHLKHKLSNGLFRYNKSNTNWENKIKATAGMDNFDACSVADKHLNERHEMEEFMDVSAIAQHALALLLPYLPKIVEGAMTRVGENIPEGILRLWNALKGRLKSKNAKQKLENYIANPKDPSCQEAVLKVLTQAMTNSPDFTKEIFTLVQNIECGDITVTVDSPSIDIKGDGNQVVTGTGRALKIEQNFGTVYLPPESKPVSKEALSYLENLKMLHSLLQDMLKAVNTFQSALMAMNATLPFTSEYDRWKRCLHPTWKQVNILRDDIKLKSTLLASFDPTLQARAFNLSIDCSHIDEILLNKRMLWRSKSLCDLVESFNKDSFSFLDLADRLLQSHATNMNIN